MNFIFAGAGTVALQIGRVSRHSGSYVLSDADTYIRGRTVGVRGWRMLAHQPKDPVFISFELVPLHRHYLSRIGRTTYRVYRFFRKQREAFTLRARSFVSLS